MKSKDIKGFYKKDFGGIVYLAVALCELVSGILLIIQKDISTSMMTAGCMGLTLVLGIGYLLGYLLDARSRFRPGWTLPLGILLTLFGGTFIAVKLLNVEIQNAGITSVVLAIALFMAVVTLSASIQVKALVMKRWIFQLGFSTAEFVYIVLCYFNFMKIREQKFMMIAVLLILASVQTLAEAAFEIVKINHRITVSGE